MSRIKRRRRQAADRGVYAFRRGAYACDDAPDQWDVYVESETILGPRGLRLTRREATAFAYAISVCRHVKLEVTLP